MERLLYFDGIGTDVASATTSEEAMSLSGLNFEVEKKKMLYADTILGADGTEKVVAKAWPNHFVTVRTDIDKPLGAVTSEYQVLQNAEAFDFLDDIVSGGEATFKKAGVFADGAKSFVIMETGQKEILGDVYTPYILMLNSFDGSMSVRAAFTPVRNACNNCVSRIIKGHEKPYIVIQHCKTLQERLNLAKKIFKSYNDYMVEFGREAERLSKVRFTRDQFIQLVNNMYPEGKEESAVKQERRLTKISQLITAYDQPDLANFENSAWRSVQAFADFESHLPVFRQTSSTQFTNINSVVSGMKTTNRVADIMTSL